jgi:hypothetical protein
MLATGLQGVRNYKNVDNPVLLDVARGTSDDKIVFIMVGLPARGKTHTARRLARCVRRRLRRAAARVSHAGRGVAHGNVSVRRGIYPTPTRWQFQYAMRRGQPFYAAIRDREEPAEPSIRTGTSRSCTRCRSRSSTSGTSAGACSGSSRRPSSSGPPRTHARARAHTHAPRGMIAHAHAAVTQLQPPSCMARYRTSAASQTMQQRKSRSAHCAHAPTRRTNHASCGVRRVAICSTLQRHARRLQAAANGSSPRRNR